MENTHYVYIKTHCKADVKFINQYYVSWIRNQVIKNEKYKHKIISKTWLCI